MAKERILGLDLGTASIGFALIDYDRITHEGEILRMGVRIFPETLDAKTKVPLNQQRRTKRLVRRQTRRRRQRRRDINELLHSYDLLPKYGTTAWHNVMKKDPYELRKKGLRAKLERDELGRAIYHIAKQRHFLGKDTNGIESASDHLNAITSEDEDTKTKEDRQGLLEELSQKDVTLGEYLAELNPGEQKRNKLASRKAVQDEFSLLIEHQSQYRDRSDLDLLAIGEGLREVIFFQRPTFWRLKTLGSCEFCPNCRVCPSGSWIAHQRKMLEEINNISILGNNEPLSQKARDALARALGRKESMTWTAIRKILNPIFCDEEYDLDDVKFNKEHDGQKRILGNPLEKKLNDIFGKTWQTHPSKDSIRASIHRDLYHCDYEEVGGQRIAILTPEARKRNREALVDVLISKYGIDHEEAVELTKISIKSGWEPYSEDAIRCFVSMMESGHKMGELLESPSFEVWRSTTFPQRVQPIPEAMSLLPSPIRKDEQERLERIKNPTVVRTLNELRKVVNNVIRTYGRPGLIRVELTRDLRNGAKKREEINKNIRKNETRRKEARKNLIENHIRDPSKRDIDKWLLWKECGCRCPYTGNHISFNALFGPNPSYEIEHIWPRSRSFDDSMANKTLCLSSENQIKGNRTPYEYLRHDADKWFHLTERLGSMRRKSGNPHGMSSAKIGRFHRKEIPPEFTNRQLTDTSYASKEAVASLERLWSLQENKSRVRVQAVSGQATAKIRLLWGLNGVLNNQDVKTRDDHRHHAIDALTVACIYPGAITALLREYYIGQETYFPKPLEKPWATIRNDARVHTEKIVVSHKVQRKVSGALHEETVYSKTPIKVKKNGKTYTQFVTRKNLKVLSAKQTEGIRDHHIKSIVKSRSTEDSVIAIGKKHRIVRKVKVLVNRDEKLMKPVTTGYVEVGNNHHMEIFKNSQNEVRYRVVSLLEAAKRVHRKQVVVNRDLAGFEFVNSLAINESIQIELGERRGLWIVTQVRNNGQLVLVDNNAAGSADVKLAWRPNPRTLVKNGYKKISIDPIGNIRAAND